MDVETTPRPPETNTAAAPPPLTFASLLRRLGPAAPLAVVAATMPAIAGSAVIGTAYWIAPWLRENPVPGGIVYVAGYALLGGLSLLPTYAHSILGGWAYGFALGLPIALAAFLGASILAYIVARLAAGERVIALIDEHPKWKAVREALIGSGFWRTLGIVTLIRIPPNSPFAITNLVLASTRVHPGAYLIGTIVGIAPRTAVAVWGGAQLNELTFEGPDRWVVIAGIALTLIVLAVIGRIANNAIARVTAATTRPGQSISEDA